MKSYAGIGSRKTPLNIQKVMTQLARNLSATGWTLRSGGAEGADKAFELGSTKKEIYLPWQFFNSNSSQLYSPTKLAWVIAERYHPTWESLKNPVRLMMARNTHQILGQQCNDPVKFVVCWTKDGATTSTSLLTGGTGQAIRIAVDLGIPIFNLKNNNALDKLAEYINSYK